MEITNIDINTTPFAYAWDKIQGSFSESIAGKILNFEKIQNLNIKNVLDICFGSANLLSILSEAGKNCSGIEISDEFFNYSKNKYPNLELHKVNSILDFDNFGKFDLITCNHDVINSLPTINDWQIFFQKVYNHLTNGGIFIFDCYSLNKIQDWNETTFTENLDIDILRNITSDKNSATILNNYYIHIKDESNSKTPSNAQVKKAENLSVKYSFENEEIFNCIKNVKFRYMIYTDANFTPIPQTTESSRIRIIAIKRENII